jgi:inner membrane protein
LKIRRICTLSESVSARFLRLICDVPSPIGHALGGLAAGWLVAGRSTSPRRSAVGDSVVLAVAGMAADLDLLFALHRGPTHGIGVACLVGIVAYLATRRRYLAIAVAAAYASHTLLDWLGTDSTAPIGIMALWPFRREYYESSLHIFHAISRRYWLQEFWTFNLFALLRELLILGPITVLAAYFRRKP